MMDEERLALENAFIETNREAIAAFGPQQYVETGSRGVILVQATRKTDVPAAEIRYLTEEHMAAHGLLGDEGSVIQRSVTQALRQYDPQSEVVLLFLYEGDGTPYLLPIAGLLAP